MNNKYNLSCVLLLLSVLFGSNISLAMDRDDCDGRVNQPFTPSMTPNKYGEFIKVLEQGKLDAEDSPWHKYFRKRKRSDLEEESKELDKENTPPRVPKNALETYNGHKKKVAGTLYTSPISGKARSNNVIYLWIIQGKEIDEVGVPHEARLDIGAVLTASGDEINQALLKVEIHLLSMLKKDPRLAWRTVYAGQSETPVYERAIGHVKKLKQKKPKQKHSFVQGVLGRGYNIKNSFLLHDVPRDYLNIFECLVGELFITQEFGTSERLGDKKSWDALRLYQAWPARIEALTELDLLDLRANIVAQLEARANRFGFKSESN